MSDYTTIKVSTDGRVGTITLNRPEALNALNLTLMGEVVAAMEAFDADTGIGAIVLTGSAKAFAAGADIKEMSAKSHADVVNEDMISHWDRLIGVRTPKVAAVSGYALGGGCELAMMCDLVVAAESAKFGQPETNLGIIPGLGGTQRLTRAVGKAVAMDLVLTDRMLSAEEAASYGLVSRVVPTDDLLTAAADVAAKIAAKSLPVVYAAKESVDRAFETTLREGLMFERRAFHACFAFEDRAEGMAAFVEKRKPEFKNR
ncbi:enoyl-CoA hydratase [Marmoricola endophyticus]|nr:enoyl-CoA hydratase [Marmoricola endophyticus]